MKKRIYLLLLLSAPFGANVMYSQNLLTLSECQEMALKYNKDIESSKKQTLSANYILKSMKGNYFPDISLNGTGVYNTGDGSLVFPGGNLPIFKPGPAGIPLPDNSFAFFPDMNIKYDTDLIYMAGVRLKQPLYMGGKIMAGHKLASIGRDIALLNEEKTSSAIIYEVGVAYTQLLKAQEMYKISEKYFALVKELLGNVESANKQGMKPMNDVLKVKVRYNDARLSVQRAKNARKLASMNLCHYIGKPLLEELTVSSEFGLTDVVSDKPRDISNRSEFKMLDKQICAARQQLKIDRSSMLPNVGLIGDFSYAHGLKINNTPLFDGTSFSVLLNVSVPLFHFGERKNKVNATKAKIEQLRLEKESLNEKMWLELTQAENKFNESKLECELSDETLQQATENLKVFEKSYSVGMATLTDYLEAQLLWQQAYEKHVDSYAQRILNYIGYQKASGELLHQ